MLTTEAMILGNTYRLKYSDLNINRLHVILVDISDGMYKFEKVNPEKSDKEIIVCDLNTYGLKWQCDFIEDA